MKRFMLAVSLAGLSCLAVASPSRADWMPQANSWNSTWGPTSGPNPYMMNQAALELQLRRNSGATGTSGGSSSAVTNTGPVTYYSVNNGSQSSVSNTNIGDLTSVDVSGQSAASVTASQNSAGLSQLGTPTSAASAAPKQ